jgi:hypothetical protein
MSEKIPDRGRRLGRKQYSQISHPCAGNMTPVVEKLADR